MFARALQFAARLYGPVYAAGLSYWYPGRSNYWGHNAIIRSEAFMTAAGLPTLSGRPPLGGEILSHDFVEAALLQRAGWSVWLLPELGGSYEELPANLRGYLARDRRWCQGNLQHVRLLTAKGLTAVSRLHLGDGRDVLRRLAALVPAAGADHDRGGAPLLLARTSGCPRRACCSSPGRSPIRAS